MFNDFCSLLNNQLFPSGIKHIVYGLKKNHTILSLDLWSNKIGDDGACYIADYLGTNPQLTFLK